MREQLKHLRDLETELHEVNQAFAAAARPLAVASELNDQQRQEIGAQLRAAQARWETVTRQISQVFQTDSADGR